MLRFLLSPLNDGRHLGEARGSDKPVRHFLTNNIQAAFAQTYCARLSLSLRAR
jgi:hypothetical protein